MFGNIPRSIEYAVQWVSDIVKWAYDNEISYIEATDKGMEDWTQHVHDCGKGLLANEVDSWMTGVVSPVISHPVSCILWNWLTISLEQKCAGKQKRSMTRYNGPAPGYRKRCNEVKERGYSDFFIR